MSSSNLLFIIIVFFVVEISTICCQSKNNNVTFDCFPSDKKALLKFKSSFSDDPSKYNTLLSSWKSNIGCCSWVGVKCDDATGHVIGLDLSNKDENGNVLSPDTLRSDTIDSSLLELKYLTYLDLSGNDFKGSSIPTFLGLMKQLERLFLFQANFSGIVPHQLGNLSNLRALGIGGEYEYLRVDDVTWAGNLSSLEYLDMSGVDLSRTNDVVYKVLNMLPSLVVLGLSNCGLGETNLSLANCVNRSTLPFNKVQYLDMSSNSFRENSSFCFLQNMTSLSFLDLSNNLIHQKVDWINDILWDKCHLKSLDLGYNQFYGDISVIFNNLSVGCWGRNLEILFLRMNEFNGHIPSSLGNLRALRLLSLSHNPLGGEIPISLGQLSNLEHIRIIDNKLSGSIPSSLGNLRALTILGLGSNKLGGEIPFSLGELSNLEVMDISHNKLTGSIPSSIGNLKALGSLDLSFNQLGGEIPISLGQLTNLEVIYMHNNSLEGTLSETHFANLSRLEALHIYDNKMLKLKVRDNWVPPFHQLQFLYMRSVKIETQFPQWIQTLKSLMELDLRNCSIRGTLPAWMGSSLGNLRALTVLDLSDNQLCGEIPFSLGQLSNLELMDISDNKLTGSIPSSIGNLKALRSLDLSSNQLGGKIPISLGQLSNMVGIYINNNSLEGTLLERHFANLSRIEALHIYDNKMLKLKVRDNWVPPFHEIQFLYMRSVKIETQFPQWIQTLKSLMELDLRNCSIRGTLPAWLGSLMNLTRLNLSNNHIEGTLPAWLGSLNNLNWLLLDNNRFKGLIPDLSSNMNYLDLAGNFFINGSIPESMCQMKGLINLDLSRNYLSGHLPDCKWVNLESAILSSNQLSGPIPNFIGGGGDHCLLQWLQLNNNSFTGQISSTLKKCTRLSLLDLGDNKFSGKPPQWIGDDLLDLVVLRLRNNKFHGGIPSAYCQLSRLQIMDLAHNQLTSSIPRCFGSLSGMINPAADFLHIPLSLGQGWSLTEVMKGDSLEYTVSSSQYLVNLDLSSNRLVGDIPSELMNLTDLNGLNLSHNHLGGRIRENIGDMKSLESLDLSNNNFSGAIPGSLSKLTSLSHLNLSNNDLWGPIPTGPQLQTFNDPSSYDGNPGLCGAPLPKKCHDSNNEMPVLARNVENYGGGMKNKIYMYAFITSGLATGFWGYFGVLFFKRNWREALFRHMDVLIGKLLGRH